MRNQLAAFSLLLGALILVGLLALAGSILLAAVPLLLYVIASELSGGEQARLEVDRTLSARRVVPSTPVRVTIELRNPGPALREVWVRDIVPPGLRVVEGRPEAMITLRRNGQFSFSYSVSGDRGMFEFDLTEVEVAGDFPLRSRVLRFRNPRDLVTLPSHKALSKIPIAPRRTLVYAGSLPSRRGGEGTEFFDVRMHSGGGDPRRVNWRLSARRPGEIYVNEFQEERVADIGIILDARARAYPETAGMPLFEYAASAAASLADVMIDQGNRVGFLAYGISIDWTAPGFGRAQKQRVLTRIAGLYPGDSYVFHSLYEIPDRLLPGGSQIVLVSPLTSDDVVPVIRLTALGYAVMVVSPDPVTGQLDRTGIGSGDLSDGDELAARVARAERAVLLHRLRHSGIPVVDWDTRLPFEVAVSASIGQIHAAWRHRAR